MITLVYDSIKTRVKVNGKEVDFDINNDVDFLREKFNGFICKSNKLNCNHTYYWLSLISERNTLTHNLFRDVCFIYSVLKLHTNKNTLEIHTDNLAMFFYFKNICKISTYDKFRYMFDFAFKKLKSIVTLSLIVFKRLYVKIRTRKYKLTSHNVDALFISWLNERSFSQDSYRDVYFNDISKLFLAESKTVKYVVNFYGCKSIIKATNEAIQHDCFIFPEQFLTVKDIFSIFSVNKSVSKIKHPQFTIEDIDLDFLVDFYRENDTLNDAYYLYVFLQRFKSSKFNIGKLFFNHENLTPEKATVMGMKKYFPTSKTFGLFHTSFPRNLLNLDFCNRDDILISPVPDYILFNSNEYKKYFSERYSNSGVKFANIYSYRQSSLDLNHDNIPVASRNNYESILIILSGNKKDFDLMMEVLLKVNTSKTLIFRMHPMLKMKLSNYNFNFSYVVDTSQSIIDSLYNACAVLTTYSASAIESALFGLDVGLVYNKSELLLNPFDCTSISDIQLINSYVELQKFIHETHIRSSKAKSHYNLDVKYLRRTKVFLS